MPWIELGEWAFDTDDVASVRRGFTAEGSRTGRPRTVADVTLTWGPRIALEAQDAVKFLEGWLARTGGGWGTPAHRSGSGADGLPNKALSR